MSNKTCKKCGKVLQGRRTLWCSSYCERHTTVKCPACGKDHDKGENNKTDYCLSCVRSGPRSPTWKGGHQYWQEGKLGRDKDGLSWKIQRKLAWERDNYTCVDCGKNKELLGKNPHVDHEIPYRISFSHALDNLKSRCPSCHKKVEAQRKELWGGKTFGGRFRQIEVPNCEICKSEKRRLLDNGLCIPCNRAKYLIPQAVSLKEKGLSYEQIASEMKIKYKTIWFWINHKSTTSS